MMSALDRSVVRAFYYLRNFIRDAAPQTVFRSRLDMILGRISLYDPAYLNSRLSYYNKLAGPVDIGSYMTTVGSIPMGKSMYYYDLKEHARYFPRRLKFNYAFGDVTFVPETASIVKSRPITGDNTNSILLKLNQLRHFHFPKDGLSFADKKPTAVWRGSLHNDSRKSLVGTYGGDAGFDIGETGTCLTSYGKPFLLPRQQLAYRYVLSVEGNDVATNLKWILGSNSLCLMPKPRYETWFMEGRLEAGRHYVELRDDFANLEDVILYYERHPEEARTIIREANAHVRQFLDGRGEQLISLLVLHKYFVATGQMEPDPRAESLLGFRR